MESARATRTLQSLKSELFRFQFFNYVDFEKSFKQFQLNYWPQFLLLYPVRPSACANINPRAESCVTILKTFRVDFCNFCNGGGVRSRGTTGVALVRVRERNFQETRTLAEGVESAENYCE